MFPKPTKSRGLEAPAPLGKPPAVAPQPPDNEPDEDDTPGGGTLSPQTVMYHADAQNCGNCKHNESGQCNVIGQAVSEEGGCCVWEGGAGDEGSPDASAMPPAGGGASPYGS
jgi:hypothetical protein